MSFDRLPLLAAVVVFLSLPVVARAQAPSIVSVTPTSAVTNGSEIITINGSDFGSAGTLLVGGVVAPSQVWGNTRILATMPEGDPGPVDLVVVDDVGQPSSAFPYAYRAPVLLNVVPLEAPVAGGTRLTITGENFGRQTTSRVWTVDGVAAPELAWFGHNRVEIEMPPLPSGGIKPIRMEVNSIISNEIPLEALLPPSITGWSPAGGPTQGGNPVTIDGSGFGTQPGVVVFGGVVASVLSWSPTQVVVQAPEGDPGLAPIVVRRTDGESSSGSAAYGYDPPTLTGVTPTSAPVTGGTIITLSGSNFGRASAPRNWSVDGIPAEENVWLGHGQATIVVPPLPSGGIKPIRLEIAGFVTPPIDLDVTVPTPVIATIDAATAPTAGGVKITIEGSNFGTRGASSVVTVGGAVAEPTTWTDVEIQADLPEGDPGPADVVVVTGFGASSTPFPFAYDAPTLIGVTPSTVPQAGGTVITITGGNFGKQTTQRRWTIDGVDATDEIWLGHDRAIVTAPPLPSGGIKPIRLEVNAIVSNEIPITVAATPPTIVSLTPANGPTQGGTPITIQGENFGAQPGTITVCQSVGPTSSWTPTQVVFAMPACYSGLQTLVLTTADGLQAEFPIGYDPPVITEVTPVDLPARGGQVITLKGSNFGVATAPRTVTVGGAEAEPVEWRGHDEITVSTPPVLPGTTTPVCVFVGGEGPWCYDVSTAAIVLGSIEPTSGPRSGGIRLTIRGENFGVDASTPRSVRIGTQAASDVILVGDAQLEATLPPSDSSGPVDLLVTVGGAQSSLPSGFTYETSTSVESLPTEFALHGNQPNPFSTRTSIAFDLPRASSYRLTVYDVRGRQVNEVVDRAGPGRVILQWNGSDTSGAPMASGIYFYRFEADGFAETRRMVLMR